MALNLLLLVTAVMLVWELYQRYERLNAKNDPAVIGSASVEKRAAAKPAPRDSIDKYRGMPVDADAGYFIISERTLFSEQRGKETKVEHFAATAPPLPRPYPVLVGTIMVDGRYVASFINQPAQQQARNTQLPPETWRVGDFYRGYKVTVITADQLVLENGGMRAILPLNKIDRRTPAEKPAEDT